MQARHENVVRERTTISFVRHAQWATLLVEFRENRALIEHGVSNGVTASACSFLGAGSRDCVQSVLRTQRFSGPYDIRFNYSTQMVWYGAHTGRMVSLYSSGGARFQSSPSHVDQFRGDLCGNFCVLLSTHPPFDDYRTVVWIDPVAISLQGDLRGMRLVPLVPRTLHSTAGCPDDAVSQRRFESFVHQLQLVDIRAYLTIDPSYTLG
jgi:hypothetical protein